MSNPAVTQQFIERYFGDLQDDECFELRYIRRDPRDVKSRFLRLADSAAAQAQGASGAGYDCYFGAATRQRGKDDGSVDGVVRSNWLWADLDFKDFDDDPEAAKATLRALKLWPQVLVQSGGGLQAFWRLRGPLEDPETLKSWLQRLHVALPGSDRKVVDAARVMRLPGTHNLKADYDRPEVTVAYFDQFPPYDLEQLDDLLPATPAVEHVSSLYDGPPSELDQLAEALTFISPDKPNLDYDDWTHVLMGIHDAYPGPEGLALAESWGRGYRGEIAGKWKTFAKGKYTVATVFYLAQQRGYVRPRPLPGPVITGPKGSAPGEPPKARPVPTTGLIRLHDFLDLDFGDTTWVVGDLMPLGGTSLLVAKPKVGKSFLALNVGMAVASGTPFLDRPVAQGLVAYLSLDMPWKPLWPHIARLAPSWGTPNDFSFYNTVQGADQEADHFARLEQVIAEERPALIIVDTLQALIEIKEGNNYSEVRPALRRVALLAEKYETHICMIHHTNKSGASGADAILGSQAFRAAVDTILILDLDPEVGGYSLEIENRWTAAQNKLVLGFDEHTRHAFLIDDNRERATLKACGLQILAYLATCDKGEAPEKEIRSALLHPAATINRALEDLAHWARVTRAEGKIKLPFRPQVAGREDRQLELSGD